MKWFFQPKKFPLFHEFCIGIISISIHFMFVQIKIWYATNTLCLCCFVRVAWCLSNKLVVVAILPCKTPTHASIGRQNLKEHLPFHMWLQSKPHIIDSIFTNLNCCLYLPVQLMLFNWGFVQIESNVKQQENIDPNVKLEWKSWGVLLRFNHQSLVDLI